MTRIDISHGKDAELTFSVHGIPKHMKPGDVTTIPLQDDWVVTIEHSPHGKPGTGGRWPNGCTSPFGHRYGDRNQPNDGLGKRCLHCGDPRPGLPSHP